MRSTIELPHIKLSDLLLRLDKHAQHVFALTSSSSNGWGQVLAWNPAVTFQHLLDSPEDTVAKLEQFSEEQRQLERLVIGYMAYDFGGCMHNVTLRADDDLSIPPILVASFDSWITFDKTKATIHSSDPSFISEVKKLMSKPARQLPAEAYKQMPKPTQSRAWYTKAYRQVEDYIRAGDAYQVNLTHRLEGTTTAGGRDLFCLLSQTSQADFQAYIEGDDFEVLSFSPERFIRVKGQAIETSPIKGTRPRGKTTNEDAALKADLLASPKDRAELNMITDLMRNDLGAICSVGSVKVADKRVITGYPTLWHAHSTIQGVLKPEISPITALARVMPGGSITGCPKKRAIEIIDELEPKRRGIYTGSIFTINPDGELDSSIAIRTIIKKADHVYLSVGGGIVYDSTEEDEYQESIDKAVSFIKIGDRKSRLSSDILEQQFGPTTLEVLYQDDKTRIICTKSKTSGQILELSRVTFIKSGVTQFANVHHDIVTGQSMGKAFRSHGIPFVREVHSSYRQTLPDSFSRRFGSNNPASVVSVSILVGPDRTPYAQILETYSPHVIWPTAGNKPNDGQRNEIQLFNTLLEAIKPNVP